MNNGGDAAEQIVRMSLEGAEVAVKITGAGAKNIAILLYSILKEEKRTKGKSRLTNMLRSGKELKVFTVRNEDVRKFQQEAKRYGVLYCVLKDKDDKSPKAIVDVIARAEDASKINRIVERFNFVSVEEKASIVGTALESIKSNKTAKGEVEIEFPEKDAADKLLDDVLAKPMKKEEQTLQNPSAAKTEKSPLSEPSSDKPKNYAKGTIRNEKQSVREELRKIFKSRKEKEAESPARNDRDLDVPKNNAPQQTRHQQPTRRNKSKKGKAR